MHNGNGHVPSIVEAARRQDASLDKPPSQWLDTGSVFKFDQCQSEHLPGNHLSDCHGGSLNLIRDDWREARPENVSTALTKKLKRRGTQTSTLPRCEHPQTLVSM